jgi:hypothetical protein
MSTVIECCEYGKLCQPDGAIVDGTEHRILGFSPGFPEALLPSCSPAVLKIAATAAERRREGLFDDCKHATVYRPLRADGGEIYSLLYRFQNLYEGGSRDYAKSSRAYLRGRIVLSTGPSVPLSTLLRAMGPEALRSLTSKEASHVASMVANEEAETDPAMAALENDPFLKRALAYLAAGIPIHLDGLPIESELFHYADALYVHLPKSMRCWFSAGWNVGSSLAAGFSLSWGPVPPSNAACFHVRSQAWTRDPRTLQLRRGAEIEFKPYDPDVEFLGRTYAAIALPAPGESLSAMMHTLASARVDPCRDPRSPSVAGLLDAAAIGLRQSAVAESFEKFREWLGRWLRSEQEVSGQIGQISDLQKRWLIDFVDAREQDPEFPSEDLIGACLRSSVSLCNEILREGRRWRTRILAGVSGTPSVHLLGLLTAHANQDGSSLSPRNEEGVRRGLSQLLPFHFDAILRLSRMAHHRIFARWLTDHEVTLAVTALARPASPGWFATEVAAAASAGRWHSGVRCALKLASGTLPDAEDSVAWQSLGPADIVSWRERIFSSPAWAEAYSGLRAAWQPILNAGMKLETRVPVPEPPRFYLRHIWLLDELEPLVRPSESQIVFLAQRLFGSRDLAQMCDGEMGRYCPRGVPKGSILRAMLAAMLERSRECACRGHFSPMALRMPSCRCCRALAGITSRIERPFQSQINTLLKKHCGSPAAHRADPLLYPDLPGAHRGPFSFKRGIERHFIDANLELPAALPDRLESIDACVHLMFVAWQERLSSIAAPKE